MKFISVDPRLWLESSAARTARHEADIAGGGKIVEREDVRVAGARVSESGEGVRVEFKIPSGSVDDKHAGLHDSPWYCMLEATPEACGLPSDWRNFCRIDVDLTVVDQSLDLEWVVVGARSRLMDRRVCQPGRTILSVDTRDIPLIQGKLPPWTPVAIRLAARPSDRMPHSLLLHGISLHTGDVPAGPVLDRFGQRRNKDWPGKMHDESEFATDLDAESKAMASVAFRADRDSFSGWAGGPRFKPGRFFRVEQDDHGRWWYVNPLGNPFWSFGTTGVRLVDNTAVEGREELFEALPPRGHPGRWNEDGTVCFHGTNMMVKFGSESAWADFVSKRLIAWGATCIGNWSDWSILKAHKVPGTCALSSRVGPAMLGHMPDVFDARWTAAFKDYLRERTASWIGDPWLVGWFVDNEMNWHKPNLLNGAGESAIRTVWLDLVRARYSDPSAFAATTGCRCASWDDVAKLDENSLGLSSAAEELRIELLERYARRYFFEVRRLLKEADPDHLYLGCRFVRVRPHECVVRAASVCDVVTVNAYSMVPERDRFDEWHRLCGRPIQIGEHQYAQYGPYLPPPIWHALTAEERRRWFPAYVRTAASMPYCVGSHWFQYVDQAGTGRSSNGENMAIGWVDVVDRPHPEMMEAVREIGAGIYDWHAGAR